MNFSILGGIFISNNKSVIDNKITVPEQMITQIITKTNNEADLTDFDLAIYTTLRRWSYVCTNHSIVGSLIGSSKDVTIYEVEGFCASLDNIRNFLYADSKNRNASRNGKIAEAITKLSAAGYVTCVDRETNKVVNYKSELHEKLVYYMPVADNFSMLSTYRFDALVAECKGERGIEYYILLFALLTLYANIPKNQMVCRLYGQKAQYFTTQKSKWKRVTEHLQACWVEHQYYRKTNEDGTFVTIQKFTMLPIGTSIDQTNSVFMVESEEDDQQGAGVQLKPENQEVPDEQPPADWGTEELFDVVQEEPNEESPAEPEQKIEFELTNAQIERFNQTHPLNPPASLIGLKTKEEAEEFKRQWAETREKEFAQYKVQVAAEMGFVLTADSDQKTELQKERERLAAQGLIDEKLIEQYNQKQLQYEQDKAKQAEQHKRQNYLNAVQAGNQLDKL